MAMRVMGSTNIVVEGYTGLVWKYTPFLPRAHDAKRCLSPSSTRRARSAASGLVFFFAAYARMS